MIYSRTVHILGDIIFSIGSNFDILTDLLSSNDRATGLINSPTQAILQHLRFIFAIVPVHKWSIGAGVYLSDGVDFHKVLNGDRVRMMVLG